MVKTSDGASGAGRAGRGVWPWLVLLLATAPAFYSVLDFPEDIDGEFPRVARPTFNPLPPPAYRLAEPGDTIDRVAMYIASATVALAAAGLIGRRWNGQPAGLWPAALGVALAAFWDAATPGPSPYGWHTLGPRALFDPNAPAPTRLALGAVAVGLAGLVVGTVLRNGRREGRSRGVVALLVAAAGLMLWAEAGVPDVEPLGYWPRYARVWGVLAFGLALIRGMPRVPSRRVRWSLALGGTASAAAVLLAGLWLIWFHRPVWRLTEVVPGKVYVSAMPTYRGLEVAQERLHFRTIVDLFPEEIRPSPHFPDELRFVRERGLGFLRSPTGASTSDEFLDRTLALAQDPEAWPVLLHCHGCMDRTPAWVGIYRFVVEGRPLDEIVRWIERHRGLRPKASVTLLYNRVLPPRAPDHYAQDPTAALLRECAKGTVDPYFEQLRIERAGANPGAAPRVTRRDGDGPGSSEGTTRRP